MSSSDDSQPTASPEAVVDPSQNGAQESTPLPELAVIGAAAEADEGSNEQPKATKEKPRSARERLNSRTREGRPKKKRGGLIALILLIVLLLGAIGAAVGGFAYLYWYANDDALDFQGTWYVAGTETPIEISADQIQLTDSVAYRYKLNAHDKTITLTLGNMTGYGSYRFSLDRDQLVIFDGRTNPDVLLESNIRWLIQALYDDLRDEPNDVTAGIRRNRTLFTREPNVDPAPIISTNAENPSPSNAQNETPQTVWSADDWLNGNSEDAEGTTDSAASSNTSSNANDVDSLLDGINDLPAAVPSVPGDTGTAAPESATP